MFRRIFKSRGPAGEKSLLPEEAIAEIEEPGEDTGEAEDIIITKITNLKELVNKRTKDLEEAQELLSQLSELEDKPGEDKSEARAQEPPAQPPQPESELAVPTEETLPEEEKDLNALMEKEAEGKEEDDSFSDLFGQGEEEENPLAGLITSLPDVTAEEILEEAKELQIMLSGRQQSEERRTVPSGSSNLKK